jgi:hypothetical protein
MRNPDPIVMAIKKHRRLSAAADKLRDQLSEDHYRSEQRAGVTTGAALSFSPKDSLHIRNRLKFIVFRGSSGLNMDQNQ